MTRIADDFASIRARMLELHGKPQEPQNETVVFAWQEYQKPTSINNSLRAALAEIWSLGPVEFTYFSPSVTWPDAESHGG